MSPTSPLVEILILTVTVVLLVLLVRLRLVLARIAAGGLAILLAMSAGIVGVNDYFGYYQSWTEAYADLTGASLNSGYTGSGTGPAIAPARLGVAQPGTVERISLPGRQSRITRNGYIYLPPQYWQPAFRHTRFPVLELLHGTPGKPGDWIVSMHINQVADQLIDEHEMGPMIMVAPAIAPRGSIQECLDTMAAKDETYIDTDVPADVRARFRVASDPTQWALFGSSAGGYCAANLGLRHRGQWGAVVSLNGYYQPSDGDAQAIINRNRQLATGNNPIQTAAKLPAGTAPLPAFYLSAGSGNADDIAEQRLFARALAHLEQVRVVVLPGGQHTFYGLREVAPAALEWSWTQLSTPDLKAQFPLAGTASTTVLPAAPSRTKRRRPAAATNADGEPARLTRHSSPG